MYKRALIAGILSGVVAADYTATLLVLGAGDQALVGKVLASDATATTYSLSCPTSEDSNSCGVPTSFSFTQGPSTVHYSFPEYDQSDTIDIRCQITSNSGICTEALIRAGTTLSHEASSYTNLASQVGFKTVQITAVPTPGATGGSSTVPQTSAVSTTSATATKTSHSSSASLSTFSTSSTSSSAAATSSSASSTKVSTGGVHMITGHPQWLVGGAAAAAVAIAAL